MPGGQDYAAALRNWYRENYGVDPDSDQQALDAYQQAGGRDPTDAISMGLGGGSGYQDYSKMQSNLNPGLANAQGYAFQYQSLVAAAQQGDPYAQQALSQMPRPAYVGMSAGYGTGQMQTMNPSTGSYGAPGGASGGAPVVRAKSDDYVRPGASAAPSGASGGTPGSQQYWVGGQAPAIAGEVEGSIRRGMTGQAWTPQEYSQMQGEVSDVAGAQRRAQDAMTRRSYGARGLGGGDLEAGALRESGREIEGSRLSNLRGLATSRAQAGLGARQTATQQGLGYLDVLRAQRQGFQSDVGSYLRNYA